MTKPVFMESSGPPLSEYQVKKITWTPYNWWGPILAVFAGNFAPEVGHIDDFRDFFSLKADGTILPYDLSMWRLYGTL